jgi:hypothetical protein
MTSTLLPAFLGGLAVGFLGCAYYLYSTLQSMYETLASYGVPAQWMMENPHAAKAIWNLRIGVVGFMVSAVVLLIVSLYLLWRNKTSEII